MTTKKTIAIATLAFILGGLTVLAIRCPDSSAIAKWRAQYETERATRVAEQESSDAKKDAWEAEKVVLQGAIDSAQAVIEVKKRAIADRDTRIAALEAVEPVAPELEAHPLVINLRAQISEWKVKFSLAQGVIAEKDEVIFSLRGQLAIQVTLTNEWKANYEHEYTLRLNCEKGIALYQKKLKFTWPEKVLWTVGGFAGGVLFEHLRGK